MSEKKLYSKNVFLVTADTAKPKSIEVDQIEDNEEKSNDTQVSQEKIDFDKESYFTEKNSDKKDSIYKRFFDIIKVKIYISTCIAITTLLFISTAIIFWAPDYSQHVLKGDHDVVLFGFVFVTMTGPVIGIIVGGAVVQKFAGGYEGKHSLTISLVFALFAFIFALPVRYMDTFFSFCCCLWGILFFGGCTIPNLQGIMISSLPHDLRAAGNAVSNILLNALGFLPAPLIYGFIFERTKKQDPKLAMMSVLLYSVVGLILLIVAFYFRNIKGSSSLKEEREIEIESIDHNNKIQVRE